MSDQITVSFVATDSIKTALETWAREADRSVSAELRQILTREAQRRQQQAKSNIVDAADLRKTQ